MSGCARERFDYGDGALVFAEVRIAIAEQRGDAGVVGGGLVQCFQFGSGASPVAFLIERERQVYPQRRVRGIEFQGRAVGVNRLVKSAKANQRNPEVRPGAEELRLRFDDGLVVAGGECEISALLRFERAAKQLFHRFLAQTQCRKERHPDNSPHYFSV